MPLTPAPAPQKQVASLPPKPFQHVDSYATTKVYPALDWKRIDEESGYVDALLISGQNVPAGQVATVGPVDLIQLSGWAGQKSLGMRIHNVVFTICDVVVGSVAVTGKRPDVAKAVHPNLEISGWQARLYGADLPTCPTAILQAWAQPPTGPVIAPLLDSWKISFIDSNAPQQFQITHTKDYLTPDKIPELVWRNIRVKPRAVNLRRCASTKCKKVGRLVKGVIKGAVIEKSDKWALILSEKGSGWIFANLIKVTP